MSLLNAVELLKAKDRGTRQAFGVVTNAQDFMHMLRIYVERELSGVSTK